MVQVAGMSPKEQVLVPEATAKQMLAQGMKNGNKDAE